MTHRASRTLAYDAELASKMPPDANATDLVMIHTIIDASAEGGELLRMHGKKIFDTDKPAEPVTLKDAEIIRIAYQSGG